jgi:putative ABC transport system permease protein
MNVVVLREGMTSLGWGLLGGLAAAAGVSRVLDRFLFGLRSLDPVSFAGGGAFLRGVALLASYLPARRAMRVDPVVALRHE